MNAMAQLTIRLQDSLAREIKAEADSRGRSVNGWIVAVLQAALDPELEDSQLARTRARLARAGLLAESPGRVKATRPDPGRVVAAREAAGSGTPLSKLVTDGRG